MCWDTLDLSASTMGTTKDLFLAMMAAIPNPADLTALRLTCPWMTNEFLETLIRQLPRLEELDDKDTLHVSIGWTLEGAAGELRGPAVAALLRRV